MSKSKIEYCDYTWNPVWGCSRGCPYCYAKRFNDRFKIIPDFSKPTFFPERMNALSSIKKPSIIFVGSMCDLWNDDVPVRWVNQIVERMHYYPQHTFLLLTKNLGGYSLQNWQFPKNCWLGFTYDGSQCTDKYHHSPVISELAKHNHIWLSIEPLTDKVTVNILDLFLTKWEWVVVGGKTPKNNHKEYYVDSIVNICYDLEFPVFLKKNLHYPETIQQYPKEFGR